jgi:hypothetical protein
MRVLIMIAALAASPALACDMDGMFGFSHYAQAAGDQAAADAMREAAIAQARDNFMARHGLAQTADSGTGGDTAAASATVDLAANMTATGTPQ